MHLCLRILFTQGLFFGSIMNQQRQRQTTKKKPGALKQTQAKEGENRLSKQIYCESISQQQQQFFEMIFFYISLNKLVIRI